MDSVIPHPALEEQRNKKLSKLEIAALSGISFVASAVESFEQTFIDNFNLISPDKYYSLFDCDLSANLTAYLTATGIITAAGLTLADNAIQKMRGNPEKFFSKRYLKTAAASSVGFVLGLIPLAVYYKYFSLGDLYIGGGIGI